MLLYVFNAFPTFHIFSVSSYFPLFQPHTSHTIMQSVLPACMSFPGTLTNETAHVCSLNAQTFF